MVPQVELRPAGFGIQLALLKVTQQLTAPLGRSSANRLKGPALLRNIHEVRIWLP
jgi:hypothetical protein